MWLPLVLEPAVEQNKTILPLTSFRRRSGAVLAISCDRAASHISGLLMLGPLQRLPKRLDTPAKVMVQHGAVQLWRAQEGGRPRRREDWGFPCGGRWCITLGQDVLDGLCLLLYWRELLGTVLDSVAKQSSLGDESAHY